MSFVTSDRSLSGGHRSLVAWRGAVPGDLLAPGDVLWVDELQGHVTVRLSCGTVTGPDAQWCNASVVSDH